MGKISTMINKMPEPTPKDEAVATIARFGVTYEGRILPQFGAGNVPALHATIPLLFGGEKLRGNGVEPTLIFLVALREKNIIVQSVDLYDDTYLALKLSSGTEIVYNTSIEPEILSSSLQSMLSQFTIEGKTPKKIDMRFGKPVVIF